MQNVFTWRVHKLNRGYVCASLCTRIIKCVYVMFVGVVYLLPSVPQYSYYSFSNYFVNHSIYRSCTLITLMLMDKCCFLETCNKVVLD